jgi:hypothetical protein
VAFFISAQENHHMKYRMSFTYLSMPLVLLALAGCSSQPASDVSPEQSGAIVTDSQVVAVGDQAIKSIELDGNGKRRDAEGPVDPNGSPIQRTLYFDLDSYTVKPEYQSLLQQHARSPMYRERASGGTILYAGCSNIERRRFCVPAVGVTKRRKKRVRILVATKQMGY